MITQGVRQSDSGIAQALRCPVDGNPLASHRRSGMAIATCDDCHGLWLTKDVVAAGGPSPDRHVNRVLVPETELQPNATERMCPSCPAILIPRIVRGVEVDRCQKCGGVWLDAGEYERLRTSPEAFSRLAADREESESPVKSIFEPLSPVAMVAEGVGFIGEALINVLGGLLDGA